MTVRNGTVYLVGAGPGDPGLITVRGLELLRCADVIVHDRLIGPELLDEARPGAELIDAGKRPGRHTLTQGEINALLVERGLGGEVVVRLKGGDPFVFGRGWEELEACRAAGVVCEVVPGVTSAIAAASSAGIPVTRRGVARSLTVVTARSAEGEDSGTIDFAALARLDTVVFMMGIGELHRIVAGMLRAGSKLERPVAIVERGTMAGQRQVSGTLGDIEARARESGLSSPAVIIVGDVAACEGFRIDGLARPLEGRRIVVTRPRSASYELTRRLRELGAEVIDCPLIRIVYREPEPDGWERRIGWGGGYDWIAVTSRHGARGFARALRGARLDGRALRDARIAAVGPTTARELKAQGFVADLVPELHRASGLIEALGREGVENSRVLLPCGTLAREELSVGLRGLGARVDELLVYETELLEPDVRTAADMTRDRGGADAILFASPSAAVAFRKAGLVEGEAPIVCIGPTTGKRASELGFGRVVVAEDHSDLGLVDATVRAIEEMEVCHA